MNTESGNGLSRDDEVEKSADGCLRFVLAEDEEGWDAAVEEEGLSCSSMSSELSRSFIMSRADFPPARRLEEVEPVEGCLLVDDADSDWSLALVRGGGVFMLAKRSGDRADDGDDAVVSDRAILFIRSSVDYMMRGVVKDDG